MLRVDREEQMVNTSGRSEVGLVAKEAKSLIRCSPPKTRLPSPIPSKTDIGSAPTEEVSQSTSMWQMLVRNDILAKNSASAPFNSFRPHHLLTIKLVFANLT